MTPRKTVLPLLLTLPAAAHWFGPHTTRVFIPRGGSSSPPATELSLDDRVQAAMKRLGLDVEVETECEGGVCTLPSEKDAGVDVNESIISSSSVEKSTSMSTATEEDSSSTTTTAAAAVEESTTLAATTTAEEESTASESTAAVEEPPQDIEATAARIANQFPTVPKDIILAAIYSSLSGEGPTLSINESSATAIVNAELEAISKISEDCPEVQQLVSEGFDPFFSRRSLAFAEMNVEDARAILVADQMDEDAEQERQKETESREEEMKTVTVPMDFDPTQFTPPPAPQPAKPTPAKKEDVIFEGTTSTLQSLVLESPVPVLLDVYADWCGPCKHLTPILEQIVINAGGMLRLVKVNTDQQRQISNVLEVTSLPTVFGIRDGQIQHMFMGMPRDETMIRNFLMGLMGAEKFEPEVTVEEKKRYEELSGKLLKLGAAASFSFSMRERLQNKILKELDELVKVVSGEDGEKSTMGMAVADDTARVLRSLMSNVIQNPFEEKFRKIKLDNKVIASKVS